MNPELAAGLQNSRATIVAELAAVLRDADASTTSIDSAIAKTNVSLQEIAAGFGGKRELLLAMVSQLTDSMAAPLAADSTKLDSRQRLLEFGRCVSDIYASSHLRALHRIAITESIRHTGLGRDFYEAGPGRLERCVADFLRIAQTEGEVRSGDPHLLASHLLSLLRANLDVADTFSLEPASRPVADGANVRNVVDLFWHGIGGGRQQ